MNYARSFHFEGRQIAVHASADGRLWFCAEAICAVLCFSDSQAALLYHCKPSGILFGNEASPQAMIDLRNLLQLSHHSPPSHAARLHDWLCNCVLASQLGHSGKPQRHQLTTNDQQLQLLRWQESWWLEMQDAVELFGSGNEPLPRPSHPE